MYELLPSDTSTIRYEETDLSCLIQHPCRFKCGVYLICTQGNSIISSGVQQYVFDVQTELIFLTGSLIQLIQASADFKVRMLLFPKDVFLKAILPVDTPTSIIRTNIPAITIRQMKEARKLGGRLFYGWIWHKCYSATT